MKLVSTKRTQKETEKSRPETYKPDPYPYNTRVCLDKAVLDKLGLSPTDFKVDQKVTLEAVCRIKSLKSVEGKEYDTSEVELQIEQIGIEKQSKSLKDAVSKGVDEASDE